MDRQANNQPKGTKTMKRENRKAHTIIMGRLKKYQEAEKKCCAKVGIDYHDPLSDVKVVVGPSEYSGNETVTVTYDGAGHDQLSYTSEYKSRSSEWGYPALRDAIEKDLQALGFFSEDCNNWSFSVVTD